MLQKRQSMVRFNYKKSNFLKLFVAVYVFVLLFLSSAVFATPIRIIFVNEQNKAQYKDAVFAYLDTDFKNEVLNNIDFEFKNVAITYLNAGFKEAVDTYLELYKRNGGQLKGHFLYNKPKIEQAFHNCSAMVAVNDVDEVVGYMVWTAYDGRLEIDIIETNTKYRRYGVGKYMIQELLNKFTGVVALSGSVMIQAEEFFAHMGWEKVNSLYSPGKPNNRHFKITKPVARQLDVLPDGLAIAVFSQADAVDSKGYIDFYTVKANKTKYNIKYFKIDLNENGELLTPIVTEFHPEGYVGIYLNKELITEGKAKHLFANPDDRGGILVVKRIIPCNPELFAERGIFFNTQTNTECDCLVISEPEQQNSVQEDLINHTKNKPKYKISTKQSIRNCFDVFTKYEQQFSPNLLIKCKNYRYAEDALAKYKGIPGSDEKMIAKYKEIFLEKVKNYIAAYRDNMQKIYGEDYNTTKVNIGINEFQLKKNIFKIDKDSDFGVLTIPEAEWEQAALKYRAEHKSNWAASQ